MLRRVFMNLSIVFLLYLLVFTFVQGVFFSWSRIALVFMFVVFGLAENNESVIVRFGLCCVECYLFVCYVVGFVCFVRCVASCECE